MTLHQLYFRKKVLWLPETTRHRLSASMARSGGALFGVQSFSFGIFIVWSPKLQLWDFYCLESKASALGFLNFRMDTKYLVFNSQNDTFGIW
jgi:hypothetical protein